MAKPLPLPVWDRKADHLFQEFMGDHPSTYESKPRWSLTQWLESEPLYDWLVALYQNTGRSAGQIEPFIQKHHIDMSEFKPVRYRSFAEFFDREFLPGARPFVSGPNEMAAFAEARYFGWQRILPEQRFPIKGRSLNAEQALGSAARAAPLRPGSPIGRTGPRKAAPGRLTTQGHITCLAAVTPDNFTYQYLPHSWNKSHPSEVG